MKAYSLAGFLLASTATALSSDQVIGVNKLAVRQTSTPSQSCPNLQANSGNGDRIVGIVIDTSGSNVDTDPNDYRFVAGKSINNALISTAEAANGRKADKVTIIDFDSSATVLYPLGDPAGADSVFDQMDSSGGTSIYLGLKAAIDEFTRSSQPLKDRSGIVVFTDGEDSSTSLLVQQINNASSLGIRVSFGFLSSTSQPTSVTSAILKTGGIYSGITDAGSQQSFASLVFSHGLTNGDSNGGTSTLLSGLNLAAFVANPGPNKFVYDAQAGEKLNFTLVSMTAGKLDATLKDGNGQELKTASTDAKGRAELLVDITSASTLEMSVVASNMSSEALFTVLTTSSLGVSNCTLSKTNTTTPPPTNNTGSPSTTGLPNGGGGSPNGTVPTPTLYPNPPPLTGAAASVFKGWQAVIGKVSFVTAALLFAGVLL